MTADKLKPLAERINRLLDERDGINGDISDLYQEAKSAGYIPKVLRKAIARQRMDQDKRAEEDSILELYEGALDGKTRAVIAEIKAGATLDATSEKTGTPRRTVARIAKTVPKTSRNGTAPDEMTADDLGQHETTNREADTPAVAAGRLSEPSDPAAQAVNPDPPLGRVSPDVLNGHGEQPGTYSNAAPQPGVDGGSSVVPRALTSASPASDGGVGTGTESCGSTEGRAGQLLAPNCDLDQGEQPGSGEAHKDRKTAGTPNPSGAGRVGDSRVSSPGPQDPIDDNLEFPPFLRRAAA